MIHTRWCHSMAGEEYARIHSWGNDPKRKVCISEFCNLYFRDHLKANVLTVNLYRVTTRLLVRAHPSTYHKHYLNLFSSAMLL